MLIEGSSMPSVYLGRGQQRVVPLTARWQRLIDGGFVIVRDRQTVILGRRRADG